MSVLFSTLSNFSNVDVFTVVHSSWDNASRFFRVLNLYWSTVSFQSVLCNILFFFLFCTKAGVQSVFTHHVIVRVSHLLVYKLQLIYSVSIVQYLCFSGLWCGQSVFSHRSMFLYVIQVSKNNQNSLSEVVIVCHCSFAQSHCKNA